MYIHVHFIMRPHYLIVRRHRLKPYKLMENQCGLSTEKQNRLSGPNNDFMHKHAACREVWECPQGCFFTKMQVECSILLVATVSFIPQPILIPSIPDDHVAMDILIHVNHTHNFIKMFSCQKSLMNEPVLAFRTTSMFAKICKLGTSWHALCYCVRLLACGCVFSLVSRFSCHSICSLQYQGGQ